MSHPFAAHMGDKVEKSRVSKITRGYSNGGMAAPGEARKAVKTLARPKSLKIQGDKGFARLDKRARGGKVSGKGRTTVNVIIAPQGGDKEAAPMMPPLPAGGPMLPPKAPPMMPPPGAMAGGPTPPLRNGGRAYASGGAVKEASLREGTKVSHSPGKSDTKDIVRPKQVTFKTGGKVEAGNKKGPSMDAGAGTGEGRIEKIAIQKRSKR